MVIQVQDAARDDRRRATANGWRDAFAHLYLLAIGLSFLSTVLSVLVYALVPVVYGTLQSIYARREGSRPRES